MYRIVEKESYNSTTGERRHWYEAQQRWFVWFWESIPGSSSEFSSRDKALEAIKQHSRDHKITTAIVVLKTDVITAVPPRSES